MITVVIPVGNDSIFLLSSSNHFVVLKTLHYNCISVLILQCILP